MRRCHSDTVKESDKGFNTVNDREDVYADVYNAENPLTSSNEMNVISLSLELIMRQDGIITRLITTLLRYRNVK